MGSIFNSGLPVNMTGSSANKFTDWGHLNATEGNFINVSTNNLGNYPLPSSGNTTYTSWRTATAPTVTANAWYRYAYGILSPRAGHAIYISSIAIEVTAACELTLYHTNQGTQSVLNAMGTYQRAISASGIILFEFPQGILVRMGERIDLYGCTTTSTGVNWCANAIGFEITDDFCFDTDENILVLGDSICGIGDGTALKHKVFNDISISFSTTAATSSGAVISVNTDNLQVNMVVTGTNIPNNTTILSIGSGNITLSKSVTGTISSGATLIAQPLVQGLWPYIVRNNLQTIRNLRYRLINIGIGGTNTNDWAYWVSQGKLSNLNFSIVLINLGVNDCPFGNATNWLTQVAGVDGKFKTNVKAMLRNILSVNPKAEIVWNNITNTDVATDIATITSGIYTGQSSISAHRTELANAISEMLTLNPSANIKIAATDNAFDTSVSTPFIATNVTAGTRLHPNDTVGQPAMAKIIISTMQS